MPPPRVLFVVGSRVPSEDLDWLGSNFPNSRAIRFSTRGAVRESVRSLAQRSAIDSLCLIGSNDSVPTFNLEEEDESANSNDENQIRNPATVESDLLYTTDRFAPQVVPHHRDSLSDSRSYRRVQSLGVEHIAGIIPVGRVPFDDPQLWRDYLERSRIIRNNKSHEWIAISDSSENWVWECRTVLNSLGVAGELLSLPEEYEEEPENDGNGRRGELSIHPLQRGARMMINLHGGAPRSGSEQSFYDNYGNDYGLPKEVDYQDASLFLFSCYGGNSYWWEDGAIKSFLVKGGILAIAASAAVWCSDPDETAGDGPPPGAVQLCFEFFKFVDMGIPIGDALSMAKMATMKSALESDDDWLFFKAFKEIVQFSLFGAPWVAFGANADSNRRAESEQGASNMSLLDRVRSRSSAPRAASQQGGRLIDEIRSALKLSLGQSCELYSLSATEFTHHFNSARKPEVLKAQLAEFGLQMSATRVDRLSRNGKQYFWVPCDAPGNRTSNGQHSAVIDQFGQVLKIFRAKRINHGKNF